MRRTRIQKDINDVLSTCLDISGIYYVFTCGMDASGIVLIVGTPGTPYHGGYYFFKFEIPKEYPYIPPSVTLLTHNGLIRFHPAFSSNGKVKLPILSSSKWCPAYSILTIIEELYICMTIPRTEDLTLYQNCWFAVCKMLRNPPQGCHVFLPMMIKHYKENQPQLLNTIQNMHGYERIEKLLTLMPA